MQHLQIGQQQWRMNAYAETQWWTQVVGKKEKHAHQKGKMRILVSDSSVYSVSIHKFIPIDSFLFLSYTEKDTQTIRVRSSCHSLDCIEVLVLAADRVFFCVSFLSI
jgi:hypothetical protein